MKKSASAAILIPLFFGFYIMGFVDFTGIATSYVKAEFADQMPEEYFGFLPSAVLFWFLILSIPSSLAMSKIGVKNTAVLSAAITVVSAILPFAFDELTACVTGFALLGAGNVILQVAMMPLLSACVGSDRLASAASAGQSIKALSSFFGPFIALFAASQLGSWRWIFPIFGATTVIFGVWLYFTKVPEGQSASGASVGKTFSLLLDKSILPLFLGIVAVVGIDMGMNMFSPMILMDRLGLDSTSADSVKRVGLAPSVYFACRTFGTFVGAWLLVKISSFAYFRIHICIAIVAIAALAFARGEIAVLSCVGLVGYAISSIYSIIFARAMTLKPEYGNEISGLMTTGIAGGALLPPLMTFAAGRSGISAAAGVLLGACFYLLYCSFSHVGKKARTDSF